MYDVIADDIVVGGGLVVSYVRLNFLFSFRFRN